MCNYFIAFCIKPCYSDGIRVWAWASPGERVADLPAAAVAKTFSMLEEELVVSRILLPVAVCVARVFCVSPWGSQAAHFGRCESPMAHRPRASFKNADYTLACPVVVESAVQGCLSVFSPVVLQYQLCWCIAWRWVCLVKIGFVWILQFFCLFAVPMFSNTLEWSWSFISSQCSAMWWGKKYWINEGFVGLFGVFCFVLGFFMEGMREVEQVPLLLPCFISPSYYSLHPHPVPPDEFAARRNSVVTDPGLQATFNFLDLLIYVLRRELQILLLWS